MIEIGPNLMRAIIETGGNVAGVSIVGLMFLFMYKIMTKD